MSNQPDHIEEPVDPGVVAYNELFDRYKRALASFDNLCKQKAREVEQARDDGERHVAGSFLEIADDLRRAIKSMTESVDVEQFSRTDMLEGIQHIFEKFISVLKRLDVEGFQSEGRRFTAELMEAIGETASKTLEPGTVAMELEQGFTRRGKLLRPARVVVAVPESTDDDE